jgi:ATP-dependent Clp protease ATP-binding subunit ClpA
MHDRDRFDRFTERARKVLSLAQEEAQRFKHNYIGTEHLLLGLIREEEGVGARVLNSLGADADKVRRAIEFIIGRGDRIVLGEVGLTPRSKKVIELAVDEARSLGHHYIGTEHLLLGLLREGEGIAAGVLESLGIKLDMARQKTLEMLQAPEQDQGDLSAAITARKAEHYEGFTAHAREVMEFAEEEARAFQRGYIGTEHLLLGLLREKEGIAASVLSRLGVDYARVHRAIESILGRGESPPDAEITLVPRLNSVIALARDEAHRMNHPYVGTEHLLLGLVREGQGPAVGILETMGVEMERIRAEVMALINPLK